MSEPFFIPSSDGVTLRGDIWRPRPAVTPLEAPAVRAHALNLDSTLGLRGAQESRSVKSIVSIISGRTCTSVEYDGRLCEPHGRYCAQTFPQVPLSRVDISQRTRSKDVDSFSCGPHRYCTRADRTGSGRGHLFDARRGRLIRTQHHHRARCARLLQKLASTSSRLFRTTPHVLTIAARYSQEVEDVRAVCEFAAKKLGQVRAQQARHLQTRAGPVRTP